jgi:Ca2+-binding EF-hand superfamily protein
MKKLLLTSIAAVMGLSLPAMALAENHEGGDHADKKGYSMMEKMDVDGDGLVSKTEFLAKHEEKFTKMDTNGDGSVSKDEMTEARKKWDEKKKEHYDKMKEKTEESAQ